VPNPPQAERTLAPASPTGSRVEADGRDPCVEAWTTSRLRSPPHIAAEHGGPVDQQTAIMGLIGLGDERLAPRAEMRATPLAGGLDLARAQGRLVLPRPGCAVRAERRSRTSGPFKAGALGLECVSNRSRSRPARHSARLRLLVSCLNGCRRQLRPWRSPARLCERGRRRRRRAPTLRGSRQDAGTARAGRPASQRPTSAKRG